MRPSSRLSQKIQDAKTRLQTEQNTQNTSAKPQQSSVMAQGLRMAGLFVAAILSGLFLGWGLDVRLNTAPWMQISGAGIGFCCGVYGLVRLS